MARVTVEDCVKLVPDRFKLVLLAARRARDISAGLPPKISRDNDKNPVVALREIAGEHLLVEELENSIIRSHQRIVASEESDEEILDFMQDEKNWDGDLTFEEELSKSAQIRDGSDEEAPKKKSLYSDENEEEF